MPVTNFGSKILKFVDQGWVEYTGGQGFIAKSNLARSGLDLLNSVNLKFFLFSFFTGGAFIFLVLVYFFSLK